MANFYDFRFKWAATAAIGIHPTKAWLSQLVNSKMQSGREDTLEERYAIKFRFKLGKNAKETYGLLQIAFWPSCMNRASVFEWHKRFKEGSAWGMTRGVGWVRKSIDPSWLDKVLGLGLLYWGFKGVQEEIPWEEARTLQIGSRWASRQPPYSPDLAPCDFWLFPKLTGCRYETTEEMKEAATKVIDTLT